MKPRSSGEIEIWSMGRSLPLKWAMGAFMVLLEEQAQRIPAAGQEARDRDFLERDHRDFRHRGFVARELHYPCFLTRGQRRDEGLARLERRGDPLELAARHGEPDVVVEPERHCVLRALVDRRPRHRLAFAVEAPRLVGLET